MIAVRPRHAASSPRRHAFEGSGQERDGFETPRLSAWQVFVSACALKRVGEGASNLRGECEAQQGDALRPIEARGYLGSGHT